MLIWCAAAWHLQDRDKIIGSDPVTRSQRLKLVVQSLGLALRELPAPNASTLMCAPELPETSKACRTTILIAP